MTPIGEFVATISVTINYFCALELSQPFGEKVGGDPGRAVLELAVAAGTNQQLTHDEKSPTVSDHIEGFGEGAVLIVGTHAINVHFKLSIYNPCFLAVPDKVL